MNKKVLLTCGAAFLAATLLCSCDQRAAVTVRPRTPYPPEPNGVLYKWFVEGKDRIEPQIGKRLWYVPSPTDINWFKFYTEMPNAATDAPDVSFRVNEPTSFKVLSVDDSRGGFGEAFAKIQLADKIAYIDAKAFRSLDWKSSRAGNDRLQVLSPEDQLRADAAKAQADKVAEIEAEKRSKETEKILRKLAKTQGVRIGMTKEEVLGSNWGRPEHVNKTITAGGTHEQWVYGGGYLYFENGVLTTIQN